MSVMAGSWMDSIPTGGGLSVLNTTNDNAVAANPNTAPASSGPLAALPIPTENVWFWLGAAGGGLLLYKAVTERNGEAHVSDIRVSLTNGLVGSAFIVMFIWIWRLAGGAAVAHGGVLQTIGEPVVKFFG